jgi:septal ring factor EnvC (AmiA/AmiB activator)
MEYFMITLRTASSLLIKAVLLGSLAFGLAACDKNKAAREQAQSLLSQQQTENSHLQRQVEQAQADLAQIERSLTESQASHAAIESEQAQRSARLTEYLSGHKAAVLALAASSAGALTALDDDTRQAVDREMGQGASGAAMVAGIVGAGFCIFNADECTSVGSYLAGYGMERKANREHLQQVNALLQQLAQSRTEKRESLQKLEQQLEASRTALAESESRIAQLRCKTPLC